MKNALILGAVLIGGYVVYHIATQQQPQQPSTASSIANAAGKGFDALKSIFGSSSTASAKPATSTTTGLGASGAYASVGGDQWFLSQDDGLGGW